MPPRKKPRATQPTARSTPSADELPGRIATGLHKIGLAMKQQAWQQANGEGLSPTQGQILAVLTGGPPLTGTELARRLGVTLPTVSDSVRVLVDKKLVTRSADPRHPRASLLTPTAKGARLGEKARSWPEFMANAVGELGEDEQRAFYKGIIKMLRSLQEAGRIPVEGMCVTCSHFRPNVRPGPSPHHCAFVDAPLSHEELRLDCPDATPASDEVRRRLWNDFVRSDREPDDCERGMSLREEDHR